MCLFLFSNNVDHFQDVIKVSVGRSFVLSMFITENTCSHRYVVRNMHKAFVARDVTLG